MSIVDDLLALYADKGRAQYGGEPVSQLAHALQSAALAEAEGAGDTLIAAALLHDVGHLVDRHADGAAEAGVDRQHEDIAAGYLARWFAPAVVEPIRRHVAAKRCLVTTEPGYFAALSEESVRSLKVQGGAFTPDEASRFLAMPGAEDALRLRKWDDLAKVANAKTPDLARYRRRLEAGLKPSSS
ncbi:MAG: HD domain-containing protein [Alphaproteobacteria bacterium]|nr:HD domain-containing protein [Alphaproteobacteria bacterium]